MITEFLESDDDDQDDDNNEQGKMIKEQAQFAVSQAITDAKEIVMRLDEPVVVKSRAITDDDRYYRPEEES